MNYKEILDKYSTPLYVYDENTLINRVNYIKSKLDKNFKIIYAVKANTFIIPLLTKLVDGFELCSFGEVEICNKLNIDSKKFVISGVNKDEKSISYIMSNYDVLKYTIESYNQYKLLSELALKYNKKIDVLIRLSSSNQFGVIEEDFEKIIKENENNNYINILGIQYFTGTQKHSIKKVNKEIDYLNNFISLIESKYPIKIKEVEYGTGSPVFYFQGEEFDEDTYFEELNKALNKLNGREISLEIGRSISASCGIYLTRVVDIKTNKYGNTVILDGGMNHLVYYGQTMAMRVPHFDIFPKRDCPKVTYNLYGSLCTINDIIIKDVTVNKLQLNDTFIFKNVGAYSSTEAIALFLSRELPKIIICDSEGNYHVVRDALKTSEINFPCYR